MKSYQSHKVVEAGKIMKASWASDDVGLFLLDDNEEVRVDTDTTRRVAEMAGGLYNLSNGYFVRYEDGYESWSPAQAFEEGYTEIE